MHEDYPWYKRRAPKMARKVYLLFLFVVSQYIFIHSSFFALKEINIQGNNILNKDEILVVTNEYMRNNLFLINPVNIQQKLKKEFYLLRTVNLKKRLPNKLNIIVEERTPYLLLKIKGRLFAVDKEGFLLYETQKQRPELLPVAQIPVENLIVGKKVTAPYMNNLLNIVECLDKPLLEKIDYLEITTENELYMIMKDSIKVRLGTWHQLNERLALLPAILKMVKEKKLTVLYIDLRFKDTPVVKFK